MLGTWWASLGVTVTDAFFRAFFHVSMSFNNAGFMLFAPDDSIFHRDLVTVLITTSSFISGWIGFPVLQELLHRRGWLRFSVYSISYIIVMVLLCVVCFLFFCV